MIDLTKPLSPQDMPEAKAGFIPGYVFKAVNTLLTYNYCDGEAEITMSSLKECISKMGHTFEKHHMNFEDAYKMCGWNVSFHKPAYYESGDAYYLFEAL